MENEKRLSEIDCFRRLSSKEQVILAIYYIYKNKLNNFDVFNPDIIFYEDLILEYNEFIRFEENIEILLNFIPQNKYNYIQKCIDNLEMQPWIYSKPVIWSDREKSKYYVDNLTDSTRFELYIENLFKQKKFDIGLFYGKNQQYSGESKAGIEIKIDKESLKTGNLYIEYKERLDINKEWVNSGILKKDNTIYWAIGNYKFIYFIKKAVLIDILNGKNKEIYIKKVSARSGTSKGYIISISDAEKISESIETVIDILKKE